MSAEQHAIAALERSTKKIERMVIEQQEDTRTILEILRGYETVLEEVASGNADPERARMALSAGRLTMLGTHVGGAALSDMLDGIRKMLDAC